MSTAPAMIPTTALARSGEYDFETSAARAQGRVPRGTFLTSATETVKCREVGAPTFPRRPNLATRNYIEHMFDTNLLNVPAVRRAHLP